MAAAHFFVYALIIFECLFYKILTRLQLLCRPLLTFIQKRSIKPFNKKEAVELAKVTSEFALMVISPRAVQMERNQKSCIFY